MVSEKPGEKRRPNCHCTGIILRIEETSTLPVTTTPALLFSRKKLSTLRVTTTLLSFYSGEKLPALRVTVSCPNLDTTVFVLKITDQDVPTSYS